MQVKKETVLNADCGILNAELFSFVLAGSLAEDPAQHNASGNAGSSARDPAKTLQFNGFDGIFFTLFPPQAKRGSTSAAMSG